jgi:hypothetical protein
MRPARQSELLGWYAKQPLEIRLRVHTEKIQFFREWKGRSKDDSNPALPVEQSDYAALLAGISRVRKSLEDCKSPKAFATRVDQAKARRKAKQSPVAEMLENKLLPLIRQLRHEGLSWRQIAGYIKQHHHKSITHTYICKIYKAEYPELQHGEVLQD